MKRITHFINRLVLLSVYFFITTIVVNFVWFTFVFRKLYYCSDPLIFPLMFPPYAHSQAPTDYYVADPSFVDVLGVVFLILNFLIPILAIKLTNKKIKEIF